MEYNRKLGISNRGDGRYNRKLGISNREMEDIIGSWEVEYFTCKDRYKELSQRIYPKSQLPKGIFPSCNLPNVQIPQRQLPKSALAVVFITQPVWVEPLGPLTAALGPHCSLRRLRRPNLTFGKLPLGKLHIWEVTTWEIVTCEVALNPMYLNLT